MIDTLESNARRLVLTITVLLILMTLMPALGHCQEPHPAAPMATPSEFLLPDLRLELRRGTAAPYDGILFDAPTLVRWTNRVLWLENRLRLEHDLHLQLEAATRTSHEALVLQLTTSYERELTVNRALLEDTQEDLERARRRIATLERRPAHRAFSVGLGLGASLSLTAGFVGALLIR